MRIGAAPSADAEELATFQTRLLEYFGYRGDDRLANGRGEPDFVGGERGFQLGQKHGAIHPDLARGETFKHGDDRVAGGVGPGSARGGGVRGGRRVLGLAPALLRGGIVRLGEFGERR